MTSATVSVTEVNEPGVIGAYARPNSAGPFAAVVAFGGSSGGLGPSAGWAPALAAEGFAVLAVAYFGAPGLPPGLIEIEVEVVERAIAWLSDRDEVAPGDVGVMGISRGSELALLAGVLLDGVGPIVALAPSGIVWSGLGPEGPVDRSAFTFRSEPLPFAGTIAPPAGAGPSSDAAYALRPMFETALADPAVWREAEIAVERVKGPVLLVSGEADAMWPSTPMAEMIERRAGARGAKHAFTHLHYANAGHTGAGVPDAPGETEVTHPLTGATYLLGGTPEGNAAARFDSWPRIVKFLHDALAPT